MVFKLIRRSLGRAIRAPGRLGRRIQDMLPGFLRRPFGRLDAAVPSVLGVGAGATVLGVGVVWFVLSVVLGISLF